MEGYIFIPETNPSALVLRNDTLDMLNFVKYWQENPEQNFGVQMRHADTTQTGMWPKPLATPLGPFTTLCLGQAGLGVTKCFKT